MIFLCHTQAKALARQGKIKERQPHECNERSVIKVEAVVVAQLVERSISIPEVRGSTPVIGKILLNICLLSTVLKRQK